ncbi:MAG: hypothetical protein CMM59_05530 [Rhodospirillaceae bacterium]|nr:hypothetical protein [Rhodospirillaceae bacterium]
MANILLIEDMKGVRESLAMVLEKGGHQVTQAVTGSEGLDSARAQTPDLVITDILMPDVDGSEVVIALKKEHGEKLPVLAMSGGSSIVTAENALALAREFADEVMPKPFSRNDILSAVARLTGQTA